MLKVVKSSDKKKKQKIRLICGYIIAFKKRMRLARIEKFMAKYFGFFGKWSLVVIFIPLHDKVFVFSYQLLKPTKCFHCISQKLKWNYTRNYFIDSYFGIRSYLCLDFCNPSTGSFSLLVVSNILLFLYKSSFLCWCARNCVKFFPFLINGIALSDNHMRSLLQFRKCRLKIRLNILDTLEKISKKYIYIFMYR